MAAAFCCLSSRNGINSVVHFSYHQHRVKGSLLLYPAAISPPTPVAEPKLAHKSGTLSTATVLQLQGYSNPATFARVPSPRAKTLQEILGREYLESRSDYLRQEPTGGLRFSSTPSTCKPMHYPRARETALRFFMRRSRFASAHWQAC